ncbi:hypothetical protein IQ238_09775 [Pleurocapsales cyanobacterium LEGE 06147]|nr:hypothetical protein [Pleurocapsales cyanobacterium LEGE 06147]
MLWRAEAFHERERFAPYSRGAAAPAARERINWKSNSIVSFFFLTGDRLFDW